MNASVASAPAADGTGASSTPSPLPLKGLGCPGGALVAGSVERMAKARRFKHLFGGAMRQAGIVAAAGLYALEHHVERLADDHANARRRLAEGLVEAGMPVGSSRWRRTSCSSTAGAARARRRRRHHALKGRPALLRGPGHGVLRAVTHLDVSADDVEEAVERIPRALSGARFRHAWPPTRRRPSRRQNRSSAGLVGEGLGKPQSILGRTDMRITTTG